MLCPAKQCCVCHAVPEGREEMRQELEHCKAILEGLPTTQQEDEAELQVGSGVCVRLGHSQRFLSALSRSHLSRSALPPAGRPAGAVATPGRAGIPSRAQEGACAQNPASGQLDGGAVM